MVYCRKMKGGMNMIRTDVVKLTVISAVAFRQKLQAGGSGVTILRYDVQQPGIASISKTSGDPILTVNTPKDLYPVEGEGGKRDAGRCGRRARTRRRGHAG